MFWQMTAENCAIMSGFEITSMILTPCQTPSVDFKPDVLCSEIVLPCCPRSANQTNTERCLEVAAPVRPSNVAWAVWVSSSPPTAPVRPLPHQALATKTWCGPSSPELASQKKEPTHWNKGGGGFGCKRVRELWVDATGGGRWVVPVGPPQCAAVRPELPLLWCERGW